MIGFIGLGTMGAPLCRNLAAKCGEKVLAFDVNPAPLERLKEHGIEAAASVRDVAARARAQLAFRGRWRALRRRAGRTHPRRVGEGEELTLARKSGLSGAKVFESLMSGSADSFALRTHGINALLPEQFPERALPVQYAMKDMEYLLEFASQAKVELAGAKNAMAALERAAKYFPVLVKTI